MNESLNDSEFNPLQKYQESMRIQSLILSSLKKQSVRTGAPLCEEGESEYEIVSDYYSSQSPVRDGKVKESELKSEDQAPKPDRKSQTVECKGDKIVTHQQNNDTNEQSGKSDQRFGKDNSSFSPEISLVEGNEKPELISKKDECLTQQKNEDFKIVFEDKTEILEIIEEKMLPPIPDHLQPFTPMINPLQTLLTEKSIKVDECYETDSVESIALFTEPPLNDSYKLRLRVALGSLTIDKWVGCHKSKTSYILLFLRLFFFIYAVGILALSCLVSPVSSVFTSFSIWAWMIMILYLILSIIVSIKLPKMTFWLSSIGIIAYTFFSAYSLCTPIIFIIRIFSNTPAGIQAWILELSLGAFGLMVHLAELSFNQINLSYALMPVFIAGNSLIWATLFGINASIHGNVGEAFPWMSSHITPGAIICLTFPVICCWICIAGRMSGAGWRRK